MLRVFNTLSRRKERFAPFEPGLVKMYVCGPTVYDSLHLGHGRAYIAYDVIVRYLQFLGYRVRWLVNLTDLDDKVFDRAAQEGVPYRSLADHYIRECFCDFEHLQIRAVSDFPRASDYLPQMLQQIATLLRNGFAYQVNGNIYFDTARFPRYGRLSCQRRADLLLRRLDPDPRKRSQPDFLLWRSWNADGPRWPSPYGQGRPGWHIQDTAMALSSFGPQYDIHAGGADLVFPHHDAEIAQGEALSGRRPIVKYWLHNGTVLMDGAKMAKSRGNYVTLDDAIQRFGAAPIRLWVVAHHYRTDIEFAPQALRKAREQASTLEAAATALQTLAQQGTGRTGGKLGEWIRITEGAFHAHMKEDFDTPDALRVLLTFARRINSLSPSAVAPAAASDALTRFRQLTEILGVPGTGMLVPNTISGSDKA